MTTINISPQKLLTAASHALIDAKAEYEDTHKEYPSLYWSKMAIIVMSKVDRIETLIAAAKVCDGLVCMSMDDVALVRKYL